MSGSIKTAAQLLADASVTSAGGFSRLNIKDIIVSVFAQLGPSRAVSGASDTATLTDNGALIAFTGSSASTETANDLGTFITYSVMQQGTGQVTVAAGAGVTLISDKATSSFMSARQGAVMSVVCTGTGVVFVIGNTA